MNKMNIRIWNTEFGIRNTKKVISNVIENFYFFKLFVWYCYGIKVFKTF